MGTYKCEAIVHSFYNVPNSTVRSTTTTTTKPTTQTTTTTPIAITTQSTTVKTTPRVTKPVTPHSVWNNPWNRTPTYRNTSRYFPFPIYPTTSRYFPPTIPHNTPYQTQYSSYVNVFKPTMSLPYTNALPINRILKKCLPGYVMDASDKCKGLPIYYTTCQLCEMVVLYLDIDECENNPCPPKTKCVNFNGGFQCSSPARCKVGYELNEAGDSCIGELQC